jgi:colanic acid biosynthesis glycosyl transferase WcaI
MRSPSVLFMNRVYPPATGATGRVLRDLARAFAKAGWQVTVITCGPKSGTDRDGGVRVIRVKGRTRPGGIFSYSFAWIKMLATALRLPATDLIVTLTDPPMLVTAGRIVQRVKKKPAHSLVSRSLPGYFPGAQRARTGVFDEAFKAHVAPLDPCLR